MSSAKRSMPLTRLSPLVSIKVCKAAGLVIRKFDGDMASVISLVKNSARRLTIGSMPSALLISLLIQFDDSR